MCPPAPRVKSVYHSRCPRYMALRCLLLGLTCAASTSSSLLGTWRSPHLREPLCAHALRSRSARTHREGGARVGRRCSLTWHSAPSSKNGWDALRAGGDATASGEGPEAASAPSDWLSPTPPPVKSTSHAHCESCESWDGRRGGSWSEGGGGEGDRLPRQRVRSRRSMPQASGTPPLP